MNKIEKENWKKYLKDGKLDAKTVIPIKFYNTSAEFTPAVKKSYEAHLTKLFKLTSKTKITAKLYKNYYSCFKDVVNKTGWNAARYQIKEAEWK
jgi:hypothetical protein